MRTAQELFDIIAKHLLTQNKKSIITKDGTPFCMYRGPNGLKCAIGCLIPDDKYCSEMETLGIDNLIADFVTGELRIEFKTNRDMLWDLQFLHDADSATTWKPSLETIAQKYNLNMNFA